MTSQGSLHTVYTFCTFIHESDFGSGYGAIFAQTDLVYGYGRVATFCLIWSEVTALYKKKKSFIFLLFYDRPRVWSDGLGYDVFF